MQANATDRMYLSHFGLDEPPFRITPHTDFFFDGANRGATLEALLYAITHDEGIVRVSGEVGSGKTMLCRVLMERLPKNVDTIYLSNPSLARDEILRAIAGELRLHAGAGRPTLLLRALQEHLIRVHADGRQVVVLIDEAHAMPLETLEEIRLLSNLETSRHKLLQIVLFGQPELDDNLNLPQMRQLKERITHSFRLEPLIRDDIAQYMMFRMRAAGYRGPDVFSPAAIRSVTKASRGLTRRVNIIADKALLAAFSQNAHMVMAKHVRAAVRDSEFHGAARVSRNAWIVAAAVAAGIAVGGIGLHFIEATAPATALLNPAAGNASPAAAGSAANPGGASATSASAAAVPGTTVPAAPVSSAALAPTALPSPVPAPAAQAAVGVRPGRPNAISAPLASALEAAKPAVSTAGVRVAGSRTQADASADGKAGETEVGGFDTADAGPLIRSRMAATEVWLRDAPGNAFTVQVMALAPGNERELEAFLVRTDKLTGLNEIYLYQTRIKGQSKRGLAVVFGSYPSRDKAREAAARMPEELRAHLPYLRTVNGIRREISERDLRSDGQG